MLDFFEMLFSFVSNLYTTANIAIPIGGGLSIHLLDTLFLLIVCAILLHILVRSVRA